MNRRVREPGGFVLPRPPAERRFETTSGRAELCCAPLPRIDVPAGRLLMMTIRSHDQYNTTLYSDDDRYRGIRGDRRVRAAHDVESRRHRASSYRGDRRSARLAVGASSELER